MSNKRPQENSVHAQASKRDPQQGFSLVELMVGIVVAMAAVVVVMQVFQVSEGSRRTAAGGDDAQTTGAIALTQLQRDLRQAGQGLSNMNLMGCNLQLTAANTLNNAAGLTINHPDIPAGDDDTDTLMIAYGTGNGSPEGDRINTQPGGNVYAMSVAQAFALNDWVIASPSPRAVPCALNLDRVAAAPVPPNVTVSNGFAGVSNGALYNLGQAPVFTAYAVRAGRLTACNFRAQDCRSADAANWTPVADGVVSLRAQYGRDATVPMVDGVVDTYDQTTPANACGWAAVMAVRLVLVARSGQLEKADVDAPAPTWVGAATAPIVLRGNWARYRYKTFETTVPLRNVAWQGVPAGC